ncbi:MAG: Fe-S cluster assembly sulfur transfer protein SufU [Pseudomonadota bacterium]
MIEQLYQDAILKYAKEAIGNGTLKAPTGSAMVDNPLCGDRVTVDIEIDGDQVTDLSHRVRGCLLCQASASILAQNLPGKSLEDLRAINEAVSAMIRDGAEPPSDWPDLSAFEPVHGVRSRHECVLLPFQAAVEAAEKPQG